MKRLILVASGALLLASANSPPPATTSGASADAYPTCSARITDRCVQRHERGVKVAGHAHARHGPESELSSVVAAEAPPPAAAPAAAAAPTRIARVYPRCSATIRDRCYQGGSGVRHARAVRTRHIRLAMRAGERG